MTLTGSALLVEWSSLFLRFHMIEAYICSHPPDPRTEEALVIEGLQPVPCPQECLLGHVFRFAALMQDAVTDIEHAGLVAHDKLTKRLGVTATGALDQVAVGGRTHGYRIVQVWR